ncbi:hypothetical protein AAG906_006075 [Vitis piasezkii]
MPNRTCARRTKWRVYTNVVLQALLEVKDGAWSFIISTSVIGEEDNEFALQRIEVTLKNKLKLLNGLLQATRGDNECGLGLAKGREPKGSGAFYSNFTSPSSFSAFHCVGHHLSLSNPVESNLITQTLNQKKVLGAENIPNVGVPSVVGNGRSQCPEVSQLEGFQVEGLSPSQMVKAHSILEFVEIRLIKGSEKGLSEDKISGGSFVKVYPRRNNKPFCGPNGLF